MVNTFPHYKKWVLCVRIFLYAFFVFRRYMAISTKDDKSLPINEEIKHPEVRVLGPANEQVGVMKIADALNYADNMGVDLVLIAPNATPPVCRAMDYGKYRFEREKKEKDARKKQQVTKLKEVQLSCRIDVHDFETRVNHAKAFLREGNKVKVVVRFRGREMAHMDLGREVIQKFLDACSEVGSADKSASLEGRFMSVVISPIKPSAKA